MISKVFQNIFREYWKLFLLWIIIVIITFPNNDWTFSPGIDPPLSWVYNNLFDNGLVLGKNIIFPHGPLAFFMYPLKENILLALLITALLKGLIVFNVYQLSKNRTQYTLLVTLLFSFLFTAISGFNHLLLASIILLYSNHYQTKNMVYKVLAILLTAFALYIKAYVGIVSLVLFFSFSLFQLYDTRKLKYSIIDANVLIFSLLLIWLMMYGSLSGFTDYFIGTAHLAEDNSSAAAYYPYNNWLVLALFMVTTASIFILNRSKSTLFYSMLIALSLFAAWKHGMAREDIYHTKGFYIYIILCLSIFILFNKKRLLLTTGLYGLSILLLTINIKNSVNYSDDHFESDYNNVNNFLEFISDFSDLKSKNQLAINQALETQRLPDKMLTAISQSKVDVYPWDYSIIAANELNWQPRPVIQSYAAYTSWLDRKNSDHFSSNNAPDYLIWELNKITTDINSGSFNSIDNRYLLNDEPRTLIQLIKSYDPYLKKGKFQLFNKRNEPLNEQYSIVKSVKSDWRKWIQVPKVNNGLLRAKLVFDKTLTQKMKSFVYKDEQFWVYLHLTNGIIHKYRIVPKNAEDGIWINPYLFDPNTTLEVDKIMFVASNQEILTKNVSVSFEKITFDNHPNRIEEFFQSQAGKDVIVEQSANSFEDEKKSNWSDTKIKSEIAFNGSKSEVLKPNSFSTTYSFPLDSIPFQELDISVECWINGEKYIQGENVSLVISIEGEIWNGRSICDQIIDNDQWNHVFNSSTYLHDKKNKILKCYVLNNSESELLLDDMNVVIKVHR